MNVGVRIDPDHTKSLLGMSTPNTCDGGSRRGMVSSQYQREAALFKGCGNKAGCIVHHLGDGFDMTSVGCVDGRAEVITTGRSTNSSANLFDQALAQLQQIAVPLNGVFEKFYA